ncbi:uncharacterized protein MYCFIDRAFT_174611 [Pseudocercospora fijiensis CIRAD86]|uniref:Uncharacterized protein n=1 Tax=Pseudocercospora fijiensis (strain CIRAD86) TaxID=383855 RepID=M3B134_PSEFD|nr:uncharacterized protein MYCFIDRAFT_174611 [Pseudocercospora fijiensis CIRAD86]EME83137.1 hypothetical protein MYCFIDRAFT_174611 [Pseudocercospora fijiensis CIRAD86]
MIESGKQFDLVCVDEIVQPELHRWSSRSQMDQDKTGNAEMVVVSDSEKMTDYERRSKIRKRMLIYLNGCGLYGTYVPVSRGWSLPNLLWLAFSILCLCLSMRTSHLFLALSRSFLPPAILATLYIYFYPFFHQCSFPEARHAEAACYFADADHAKAAVPGELAPFRLLVFGDPQLEGDTSLPEHGHAELFPSLRRLWSRVERDALASLTTSLGDEAKRLWNDDIPGAFRTYHKRLDLWGNDLYLAHVYRTIHWYTKPTHVAVLGDLLGSQWISDEEFMRRSYRFWHVVFRGAKKVPQLITDASTSRPDILGADPRWKDMVITVPGNHDIGYAGDIDEHRIARFEHMYNRVNWDIRFALNNTTTIDPATLQPTTPELRLIVLNSMNLDGPVAAWDPHQESIDFLNHKLYHDLPSPDSATILLTHIPLHKEAGTCRDAPFVDYLPEHHGGGIKEQNHLSEDVSQRILDGIIGLERSRKGIILNGHDHAGCDVYHSKKKELDLEALQSEDASSYQDRWDAKTYARAQQQVLDSTLTGIREVTVRSMMGDFGGNAGLLSAWWDKETKEWKFDYDSCMFGVQHIWWAVHILDLVVLGFGIAGVLLKGIEGLNSTQATTELKKKQFLEMYQTVHVHTVVVPFILQSKSHTLVLAIHR